MDKDQIIREISSHIKNRGGFPQDWYIGISQDARKRLFIDHNVDEEKDAWIYKTANSNKEAREIEDYFVNKVRTDGGPGGGDKESKMVYAYKKSDRTNP